MLILLKIWVDFMIDLIMSKLTGMLVSSITVRYIQNFRVRFELGKMSSLDIIWVYRVYVSNIVLNHSKIRRRGDFIKSDYENIIVKVNEVDENIWLNVLESVIDISNMFSWRCHELSDIFIAHKNNDLLV